MIRPFENECFVCGWFDEDGRLIDTQQYETEEEARHTAVMMGKKFETFVGKIQTFEFYRKRVFDEAVESAFSEADDDSDS